MLVLSRKRGESIQIDDTISITVLAIQGGRVRLGLSGPPDVLFLREELCRRTEASGARPRREQRMLKTVCD